MGDGELPYHMEVREISLLMEANQLVEAELALAELIEHYSLNATLANLRGLIFSRRGNKQAALKWYKRAVDLQPDNPILIGNLGCKLQDLGNGEEAEAKMRQALALDSSLIYLYERLGNLYRDRGEEERAIGEYKRALELARAESIGSEDSSETQYTIARLYNKLGDYSNANEAETQADRLKTKSHFGGDSRQRIAGPDSGIVSGDQLQ